MLSNAHIIIRILIIILASWQNSEASVFASVLIHSDVISPQCKEMNWYSFSPVCVHVFSRSVVSDFLWPHGL